IQVTPMGFGGAPLGVLFTSGGAENAVASVRHGYELGIRFFDTAPLYGRGKSERFYGQALSEFDRDSYILSSKVGRVLDPNDNATDEDDIYVELPPYDVVFDFSRDGVLRSIEESLQRLGLERLDVALIHDPDDHWEQAITEAYPTLAELRSQGVVGAIGAGMNQWEMPARFAREGDFDCFLLAGRYTLLDHSGLEELLPLCEEKSISIVLGGPYNSGVLASDLGPDTTYFYERTPPEVLETARRIKAVCDRHEVPLKAAALQFGLAHPAVAATIPGPRTPEEVSENVEMASFDIPSDLWAELKSEALIPAEAPTPA
ncbi:MAG: aldo/keto reductase, partial [Gemmatimonadetes bacterium]|nr:aldo/keto reductase [Gemmatimonadota bacterium]